MEVIDNIKNSDISSIRIEDSSTGCLYAIESCDILDNCATIHVRGLKSLTDLCNELAVSSSDLEKSCEALIDKVQKLQFDVDYYRKRCKELTPKEKVNYFKFNFKDWWKRILDR